MTEHYDVLQIKRPLYLGGAEWELHNLNEITVLFGRNGSGKSQLLTALRDSNRDVFHYTSPERSGDINFNAGTAEEEATGPGRAGKSQSNLAPEYRRAAVSRVLTLLLKRGSLRDATKASLVDLGGIEGMVQELLPDFDFTITEQYPHFALKRVSNNETVGSVTVLSSGESELLTVALDLLTVSAIWELGGQAKRVLLIDEPDMHLHPDLQQHLARFLVQLVNRYNVQVIVATHSTTLLSALGYHGGDKTSVVYLDNSATVQRAITFDQTLKGLSACLGGHALMGPLFSVPLFLVEGDDDYRLWSHVPRYQRVKLAAIPCSGADEVKKYQKTLERLLQAVRSESSQPVGYALLDGDTSLPPESSRDAQGNIKFLRLACRESENLYLTDEVLKIIRTDWTTAMQKIKRESVGYGQKKELLDTCDTWDRRDSDVKDVIVQVSEIIDPKKVHWTQRVAATIGAGKPQGQLAEFLGTDILDALWGKQK